MREEEEEALDGMRVKDEGRRCMPADPDVGVSLFWGREDGEFSDGCSLSELEGVGEGFLCFGMGVLGW